MWYTIETLYTVHIKNHTVNTQKKRSIWRVWPCHPTNYWFVNNGILDSKNPAQSLRVARHHFSVSKVLGFKKLVFWGFCLWIFRVSLAVSMCFMVYGLWFRVKDFRVLGFKMTWVMTHRSPTWALQDQNDPFLTVLWECPGQCSEAFGLGQAHLASEIPDSSSTRPSGKAQSKEGSGSR